MAVWGISRGTINSSSQTNYMCCMHALRNSRMLDSKCIFYKFQLSLAVIYNNSAVH